MHICRTYRLEMRARPRKGLLLGKANGLLGIGHSRSSLRLQLLSFAIANGTGFVQNRASDSVTSITGIESLDNFQSACVAQKMSRAS
jgi:hypothetical protein